MLSTPVFATPGARHAIDSCRLVPDVGYVGLFSGKTLDQVRQRHPDAQVMDAEEVIHTNEQHYLSQPITECDAATYQYMLEVLPPYYWSRDVGSDSFQMSELTSGQITEAFCRLGTRYFRLYVTLGTTHRAIVDRVARFIAGGQS